jgi:hypothetical protein
MDAEKWAPPRGWPIVEPGLLMAGIDNVLFVCVGDAGSSASYETHLRELVRVIDSRATSLPIGVIYDQRALLAGDAKQRARVAELLRARREVLQRTTAAFALATESPIMRGVLRAVFWMEPPPYPWSIVADVPRGLDYLHQHMPGLDAPKTLAAYRELRQRMRSV